MRWNDRYAVVAMVTMAVFFALGTPRLMDDGVQYEGFAEALAHGHVNFHFYGFQGMSFFAAPIHLVTHSPISIVLVSMIFTVLSIPLAYASGMELFGTRRAGVYAVVLFLLMPYPYVTLMRGFQEAALAFFIWLTIYGAVAKRPWTPLAWAVGGLVKPFALVLAPMFLRGIFTRKRLQWLVVGLALGALYLGVSYRQTGHLLNDAAINSYSGQYTNDNPPPLAKSFTFGVKGFGRIAANLFVPSRKIIGIPVVMLMGAWILLRERMRFRAAIIASVILNVLLVGSLTFSFAKYLLPMTVLLSLAAIPFLERHRWAMPLAFLNAYFVFLPIWDYFGKVFWSSLPMFLLPFGCALVLYIHHEFLAPRNGGDHSHTRRA